MKKPTLDSFSCHVCLLTLSILTAGSLNAGQLSNQSLFSAESTPPVTDATDRIIIKYRPGESATGAPNSAANLIDGMSGVPSTRVRQTFSGAQVIQLDQQRPLEQMQALVDEIAQIEGVEYAEPDLMMHPLFTPNDPRFNEQWHYFEETGGIRLPSAWDITQGSNTVVAVVDSGYRPHPDLVRNILPGYDMISDIFVANDGDGRDNDPTDPGDYAPTCNRYLSTWHGTHVAGTVAAVTHNESGVAGVAFEAKILPVRVLGRCGGYLSDIMDGVAWAAGATLPGLPVNQNPAQVINLSLGSRAPNCPQTAQEAIQTARQLGATVIAAAGNSNEDSSGVAPANCDGVITVAATTQDATRASFSNFGEAVDLAAPGVDILSTHNSGIIGPLEDNYNSMNGTSMSAPHVSGTAALLYSLRSDITPDEVAQILKQSAQPFPAVCSGCGMGILDALAAVEVLQSAAPDTILLSDGVPERGLSADRGNALMLAIDVPPGASSLTIRSYGGTGDADLYVRHANQPTESVYDCRPYVYGNEERCVIRPVNNGRYYIMLQGYSAYSDVSLLADYMLEDPRPLPGKVFENQNDYPIPESTLSGISSPITVSRTGPAGRINVAVTIRHTSIRELSVELLDPSGEAHKLKGFGGSGEDLIESYILDLGDLPSQGIWKLRAKDLGLQGNGIIDGWRITFP